MQNKLNEHSILFIGKINIHIYIEWVWFSTEQIPVACVQALVANRANETEYRYENEKDGKDCHEIVELSGWIEAIVNFNLSLKKKREKNKTKQRKPFDARALVGLELGIHHHLRVHASVNGTSLNDNYIRWVVCCKISSKSNYFSMPLP